MQVMAMNCGLNCVTQDATQKAAQAEHACCHDESESKDSNCMEQINGICFHESLNDKYTSIHLDSIPLFYIESSIILNDGLPREVRYLPKIPDQYQKYKSQISLFILKNQFLI